MAIEAQKQTGLATKETAAEYLATSVRTIERMMADGTLETVPLREGKRLHVKITWRSLHLVANPPKARKRDRKKRLQTK